MTMKFPIVKMGSLIPVKFISSMKIMSATAAILEIYYAHYIPFFFIFTTILWTVHDFAFVFEWIPEFRLRFPHRNKLPIIFILSYVLFSPDSVIIVSLSRVFLISKWTKPFLFFPLIFGLMADPGMLQMKYEYLFCNHVKRATNPMSPGHARDASELSKIMNNSA